MLIIFAEIDDVNEKIKMIKEFNLIDTIGYPFTVAIFYTLVYPIFSNMLYDATLYYKNKAHETKRNREDEKIITQKEKKEILDENRKLRLENYELENEKVKIIRPFSWSLRSL